MRGRTGGSTNATIQATIQLVIKSQVALDVLEYFFQLFTFDGRLVRYRIANILLDSGGR
jgi:hypothetical protein